MFQIHIDTYGYVKCELVWRCWHRSYAANARIAMSRIFPPFQECIPWWTTCCLDYKCECRINVVLLVWMRIAQKWATRPLAELFYISLAFVRGHNSLQLEVISFVKKSRSRNILEFNRTLGKVKSIIISSSSTRQLNDFEIHAGIQYLLRLELK